MLIPIPSHYGEPLWCCGIRGSSLVLTAEACQTTTEFGWWSMISRTDPTTAQNHPVFSSPLPVFSQWVPGGDGDAGGKDVSVLHIRPCQQWDTHSQEGHGPSKATPLLHQGTETSG